MKFFKCLKLSSIRETLTVKSFFAISPSILYIERNCFWLPFFQLFPVVFFYALLGIPPQASLVTGIFKLPHILLLLFLINISILSDSILLYTCLLNIFFYKFYSSSSFSFLSEYHFFLSYLSYIVEFLIFLCFVSISVLSYLFLGISLFLNFSNMETQASWTQDYQYRLVNWSL